MPLMKSIPTIHRVQEKLAKMFLSYILQNLADSYLLYWINMLRSILYTFPTSLELSIRHLVKLKSRLSFCDNSYAGKTAIVFQ